MTYDHLNLTHLLRSPHIHPMSDPALAAGKRQAAKIRHRLIIQIPGKIYYGCCKRDKVLKMQPRRAAEFK